MMAEAQAAHGAPRPRGRALLLEHLPNLCYQSSIQGVLLMIFSNGDAFFYPLSETSKGFSPNSARSLTHEQPPSKKSVVAKERPDSQNKYFAYDVPLENQDVYRVNNFNFETRLDNDVERIVVPKKIVLSHDKRLLLMFGVVFRGQTCLVVFRIQRDPEYFKVVFYDLSLTFIDACFTPDSRGLAVITHKHPDYIFIVSLPLHTDQSPRHCFAEDPAAPGQGTMLFKQSSFEPRSIGATLVIGPARSCLGTPLRMSHISSNVEYSDVGWHFATWSDDGCGEYCLWALSPPEQTTGAYVGPTAFVEPPSPFDLHPRRFCYQPRLLTPKVTDRGWLEDEETPKNYIQDIQFGGPDNGEKLMLVVRRANYTRKLDNGVGLQMVKAIRRSDEWFLTMAAAPPVSSSSSSSSSISSTTPTGASSVFSSVEAWYYACSEDANCWYQLIDEKEDARDLLCAKWSYPLLLGTVPAAAAVVRRKGLFELVDHCYASAFQSLYDHFSQSVANFVQVGRYHRFWLSESGGLGVIVVTPYVPSPHPEWAELFAKQLPPGGDRTTELNMRVLGRRVGYFITDISKDAVAPAESAYSKRRGGRPADLPPAHLGSSGTVRRLQGMHLYRCWMCRRPLLKPLQCSRCKCVVYCSRECQRQHWKNGHESMCSSLAERLAPPAADHPPNYS